MATHLLDILDELPKQMKEGLAELGDADRVSKAILTELYEDQRTLLLDMENAVKQVYAMIANIIIFRIW